MWDYRRLMGSPLISTRPVSVCYWCYLPCYVYRQVLCDVRIQRDIIAVWPLELSSVKVGYYRDFSVIRKLSAIRATEIHESWKPDGERFGRATTHDEPIQATRYSIYYVTSRPFNSHSSPKTKFTPRTRANALKHLSSLSEIWKSRRSIYSQDAERLHAKYVSL